jgi:hypothetical protein
VVVMVVTTVVVVVTRVSAVWRRPPGSARGSVEDAGDVMKAARDELLAKGEDVAATDADRTGDCDKASAALNSSSSLSSSFTGIRCASVLRRAGAGVVGTSATRVAAGGS